MGKQRIRKTYPYKQFSTDLKIPNISNLDDNYHLPKLIKYLEYSNLENEEIETDGTTASLYLSIFELLKEKQNITYMMFPDIDEKDKVTIFKEMDVESLILYHIIFKENTSEIVLKLVISFLKYTGLDSIINYENIIEIIKDFNDESGFKEEILLYEKLDKIILNIDKDFFLKYNDKGNQILIDFLRENVNDVIESSNIINKVSYNYFHNQDFFFISDKFFGLFFEGMTLEMQIDEINNLSQESLYLIGPSSVILISNSDIEEYIDENNRKIKIIINFIQTLNEILDET